MRPMLAIVLALAGVPVLPAHAQDDAPAAPLGSGLSFSGAPTQQELAAQQRACEARKPQRKASGTITEATYRRLERIVDQITKGQNAEAEGQQTQDTPLFSQDQADAEPPDAAQ